MFRFKIEDWYDIHNGFTLSLTHSYTALAGPNGAGKTTLLNQISEAARSRKIPVLRYSDISDGRTIAMDNATFWGDVRSAAFLITSSEGEQLRMNFFAKLEKLKTKLSHSPDSPSIFLIDAIDSGSSIDAQRFIQGELEKLIEEYSVYIVVSANSYEFVRNADCVDVRTGKHMRFKSYEQYAGFVCEYFQTHPYRIERETKEEVREEPKVQEPVKEKVKEEPKSCSGKTVDGKTIRTERLIGSEGLEGGWQEERYEEGSGEGHGWQVSRYGTHIYI